jgi:L-seryl-tRNA(Ser) seleniumtransferase
MISATAAQLEARARGLAAQLGAVAVETQSAIGGGSLPGQTQASWAVAFETPAADALAAALRRSDPPVVSRIENDRVLLDLRSVLPEQDRVLAQAARGALGSA